MNTRRPFLQIEQFEDRLLPSFLPLSSGWMEAPGRFDSIRLTDTFAHQTATNFDGLQTGYRGSLAGLDSIANEGWRGDSVALDSLASPVPVNSGGFYDFQGVDAVTSITIIQLTGWGIDSVTFFVQPEMVLPNVTTSSNAAAAAAEQTATGDTASPSIATPLTQVDANGISRVISDALPDGSDSTSYDVTDPVAHETRSTAPASMQSSAANNLSSPPTQTSTVPGILLVSAQTQQLTSAPLNAEQQYLGGLRLPAESLAPQATLAGAQGSSSTLAFTNFGNSFNTFSNDSFFTVRNASSLTAAVKPSASLSWREVSAEDAEPLPLAPIEVPAPAATAAEALASLDPAALDGQVARVLDAIASLGSQLSEAPDAYTWVVAAGVMSAAAGYVVYANGKPKRIARFPLDRGSIAFWEGEANARTR
jgi:hypothetical protein